MIKTKKHRKNMKKKTIKVHHVTFHGLHKWNKAMFEQLGWMVLAKEYGYKDKIHAYINSVHRLQQAIQNKLIDMNSIDKKKDLTIMLKQVNILCRHIQKDFHRN